MMKLTKIALMTGASLCLVGAALYGIGTVTGGRTFLAETDLNSMSKLTDQEEQVLAEEHIRLEKFRSVKINSDDVADVTIVPSDRRYSYLSYTLTSIDRGQNPLTYEVKDGILSIHEKESHRVERYVRVDANFIKSLLGLEYEWPDYAEDQIVLHLAEDVKLDSCEINMDSGDLKVSELNSKSTNWTLDSGDATVENVVSKHTEWRMDDGDLNVTDSQLSDGNMITDSGDVKTTNTVLSDLTCVNSYGDWKAEDCELNGGTVTIGDGDLTWNNCTVSKLHARNSYGDTTCENSKLHEVSMQNADGDMVLNGLSFSGEVRLDNQYGDIVLSLAEDAKKQMREDKTIGDSGYFAMLKDQSTLEAVCTDGDLSVK